MTPHSQTHALKIDLFARWDNELQVEIEGLTTFISPPSSGETLFDRIMDTYLQSGWQIICNNLDQLVDDIEIVAFWPEQHYLCVRLQQSYTRNPRFRS